MFVQPNPCKLHGSKFNMSPFKSAGTCASSMFGTYMFRSPQGHNITATCTAKLYRDAHVPVGVNAVFGIRKTAVFSILRGVYGSLIICVQIQISIVSLIGRLYIYCTQAQDTDLRESISLTGDKFESQKELLSLLGHICPKNSMSAHFQA